MVAMTSLSEEPVPVGHVNWISSSEANSSAFARALKTSSIAPSSGWIAGFFVIRLLLILNNIGSFVFRFTHLFVCPHFITVRDEGFL